MIDMSPSLALIAVIVVLVAAGVYLLLERSLSRVLLGVIMLGNGVNLLFLVAGGKAGRPAIIGEQDGDGATAATSDPLPQAMVLTAIVITLALTAFLLAMAYRSWQLHGHDEVQDDDEDRRIARRALRDERTTVDADTEDTSGSLDDDAASAHDETDESGEAGKDDAADKGDGTDAAGGTAAAGGTDAADGPDAEDHPGDELGDTRHDDGIDRAAADRRIVDGLSSAPGTSDEPPVDPTPTPGGRS